MGFNIRWSRLKNATPWDWWMMRNFLFVLAMPTSDEWKFISIAFFILNWKWYEKSI